MAATLTGTPTAVIWASGADPAGQSITIPADATAVYMFWSFWNATSGSGLSSATLAGNAPAQTQEKATNGDEPATGVAVWPNPAIGSQTLDVAWDASPTEGPTTIVAYVKDGDTGAWRDADSASNTLTTPTSVTLTTVSGDLVIKHDQKFGNTPPGTSVSWTSAQTQTNNNESARLSHIGATGANQVCDSENEDFSSIVAISIPAVADTLMPQIAI